MGRPAISERLFVDGVLSPSATQRPTQNNAASRVLGHFKTKTTRKATAITAAAEIVN
jgi:hypothetical protein